MVWLVKQRVVLLGGSGTMGFAAFQELRRRDDVDLVLLLRDGQRKRFAPYVADGLEVVWGDATNPDDVFRVIRGADIVLNAMAFISPAADDDPAQSQRVNVDAVANLIEAIRAEPDGAARIRLVHTSTVALTGDRLPPLHWGRVGDPLHPSNFDTYALHKMAGERLVLESAIAHIAVLRLTFIMPTTFSELLALRDPIMFHLPLATHLEAISSDDAGRGLANAVDVDPSSPFWGGVYNMGGGPGMRTTARAYQDLAVQVMGLPSITRVAERNWFATRNFHLHWFLDSDRTEQFLHYQGDTIDTYLAKLRHSTPWWGRAMQISMKAAPLRWVAGRTTKATLRRMASRHRRGPLFWVRHGEIDKIEAFFGGLDAYRAIPGWDHAVPVDPPAVQVRHGFDERHGPWSAADLHAAATFRGGSCAATGWDGTGRSAVRWTCAAGHRFTATPNTVLHAGHWCTACLPPPWRQAEEAALNPYVAQVWPYGDTANHRSEGPHV